MFCEELLYKQNAKETVNGIPVVRQTQLILTHLTLLLLFISKFTTLYYIFYLLSILIYQ
jgi:hypothetical protein